MMEAEQIRFLRIRAIEPRTNHEQRTNKEKICFCSPEMSQNVTIQIQVICCYKFDWHQLCKPALLGDDLTPTCKPAP